jgi:hypothetical protein
MSHCLYLHNCASPCFVFLSRSNAHAASSDDKEESDAPRAHLSPCIVEEQTRYGRRVLDVLHHPLNALHERVRRRRVRISDRWGHQTGHRTRTAYTSRSEQVGRAGRSTAKKGDAVTQPHLNPSFAFPAAITCCTHERVSDVHGRPNRI